MLVIPKGSLHGVVKHLKMGEKKCGVMTQQNFQNGNQI